jgi:hypothetical protein
VVVGALLALGWSSLFARSYSGISPGSNAWHERAVELERDRVLAISKGLTGAGAGFLATLIAALLKGEILAQVSYVSLVGLVVGAMGAILLGWSINIATRQFIGSLLP